MLGYIYFMYRSIIALDCFGFISLNIFAGGNPKIPILLDIIGDKKKTL